MELARKIDWSHTAERSKEFADAAARKSRELYSQAQERLPENSGMILGATAIGAGVFALGYLTGRTRSRRKFSKRIQKIQEAPARAIERLGDTAQSAGRELGKELRSIDMAPVYKLVKLWMLYRLAA